MKIADTIGGFIGETITKFIVGLINVIFDYWPMIIVVIGFLIYLH